MIVDWGMASACEDVTELWGSFKDKTPLIY